MIEFIAGYIAAIATIWYVGNKLRDREAPQEQPEPEPTESASIDAQRDGFIAYTVDVWANADRTPN